MEWDENSKLIFDKKSDVKGNEVPINPQKKGEEKKYSVFFNNLENLNDGEYKAYVRLRIKDLNVGERLILTIKVKTKEDPYADMKNHMDEIEQLRNEYGLKEDDFTNERLYDALKDAGFDIEDAFTSLYGDN